MGVSTISYLADVSFGAGASAESPAVLARLHVHRPLLVTDRGLTASGLLSRLPLEPAALFDEVSTNPSERSALAGLDVYRANYCDGVVAVGGGSPMDCAKAIALLVNHPPPLEQYAFVEGGLSRINATRPPVVCVPTTAGTGSEVGRAALLTMATGRKLAIVSPRLIPDAAVCDPLLTLGLPPQLTAATGMDAVSHCVETFCSPRYNPVADAIALDGLRRACEYIERATAHGDDEDARAEMMMAALQGGLTFQKGLGAVHALSHPLGGLEHRRLHHGTLNAVFLLHVLHFNETACPEKLGRLAEVVGLNDPGDLPRFFTDLVARLGLPTRLRDMGVTRDEALAIAPDAARDHCAATNPRPLNETDCRELLDAAY